MATSYALAPIPIWQFTKNDALYNVRGKLYTYRSVAKDEKKYVYYDASGLIAYPDPIILDGIGSVGPIYWADDEKYYLRLTDENDQLIWDVDDFPVEGSGSSPVTVEVDYDNQFVNGQFRLHNFKTLTNTLANTSYEIGEGWSYLRDNITATEKLTIETFLPGTPGALIEGNPKEYLHFECNSSGTGEALKKVWQSFLDVRAYSEKTLTLSFVAKSATSSILSIYCQQYFGTGGSPSAIVETTPITVTLSTTWDKYSVTLVVPSISGKNIGTNKDDVVSFIVGLPLNQLCEIDLTNMQLNLGNKVLEYQFKEPQRDVLESVARRLVGRNSYWEGTATTPNIAVEDVRYLSFMRSGARENWGSNSFGLYAAFPVGGGLEWYTENFPDGFVEANGQMLAHAFSPRLYTVLGNRYTEQLCKRNTSAVVSTNEITITMSSVGTVSGFADVSTGFTFTTITPGSPTVKEVSKITCNAATMLSGGEYFTFQTPELSNWICYLILDYNYAKVPTIPVGHKATWVYINKTDSADVVAQKIGAMFNPLVFRVPRRSGLFARGNDQRTYISKGHIGSSSDFPTLATVQEGWYYDFSNGVTDNDTSKTNTGVTFSTDWSNLIYWDGARWRYIYDDGVRDTRIDGIGTGRDVGTVQKDELKSHYHTTRSPTYRNKNESDTLGWASTSDVYGWTTGNTGGYETRGKNISVYYLIKY